VITVDPHLHRISLLNQAIPIRNAVSLSAAGEIGEFLRRQLPNALLLGPDSESEQWVASIAKKTKGDYLIASKQRFGDKQVEITLPEGDYRNKPVVIIDDMASTGRTLAKAARLVQAAGCREIYAVVTHALFCEDAEAQVRSAGVQALWSTDSISHPLACIHLDQILAEAILQIQ
jgi:ribose-phosphate pyrophosphokinase